jgi:Flp pilus assembly protein TadG
MTGPCQLLLRLARDRHGAIAVIFALMFPVVAAILGLGIETGIWYAIKRQDQSVADIAAYSGALEVVGDPTKCTTGACPAAVKDAKTNGFDFANTANTASTVAVSGTTVTVTLKHDQTPLMVSYFLGKNTFQIANFAVASVTSSPACASSVGGSGTAMKMSGGPTLTMPGCTLTSNSTDPASIDLAGSATIDAFSVYTAGGVVNKGASTLNLTQPAKTSQTPLKDPYCLSSTNCMSVPDTVTGFTMPTLPSTGASGPSNITTFPTLAAAQAAPANTKSDLPASQAQPGIGCDSVTTIVTDVSNSFCFTHAGVTLNLTQTGNKSQFKAGKAYYFTGPVTLSSNATVKTGVDIYIANGSFTINAGNTLTFDNNTGKKNGNNAGQSIYVNNGSFDNSAGTLAFTGDTAGSSAYAVRVGGGGTTKLGAATFGGGTYSFYGGGVTAGAGSGTTMFGAADYYIDAGGFTVNSGGTARFSVAGATSATSKITDFIINGGNLTNNGTLTFNNSGTFGVAYALQVPGAGNYALSAGSATFGAGTKFGLYGGGLTISSGANAGFNAGVNFYLAGSLTANGCAAFQGGTSTININAGSLTGGSTGSLNFNPNTTACGVAYTTATSQYNINTGGSGNGVTLGGPAAFNAGTYFFMNSSNAGTGVAVSAGSPTFAGGIYSVQNGGFSVASGATASFAAGTPCAPTVGSPPAGSCVYLANGAFSNAGTMRFATGNYYLYDPNGSGTSFTNTGTMTLGTSGSNNFYIKNAGGAFSNAAGATMNFGVGNYYIQDGTSANGNNAGGFASSGILNFRGGSGSTYYFINGPSFGTGNSTGTCSNSTSIFGALSMMGGSTTNLGPANYYLLNGDLCINQDKGTAPTLTCGNVSGGSACAAGGAGVTFILTGSSASNISTLQVPSDIATSLNAPGGTPDGVACAFTTAGCYAGVLFLQDPDRNPPGPPPPQGSGTALTPAGTFSGGSCSNHSNCSLLDGGDAMALTGAVYIPQSIVDFKSNNSANTCLVIIAEAIIFSGNSFLTANGCSQDNVKTLRSTAVALTQ